MAMSELQKLETQIKELEEKRKAIINEQRSEKLSEAKTLIKEFGFTASELGIPTGKKKTADKPKGEAKYSNPKDPSQTWSGGKGRKPTWVKEHLDKGGKLEDFAIKK
jgi:DNA-binding protein H-NS